MTTNAATGGESNCPSVDYDNVVNDLHRIRLTSSSSSGNNDDSTLPNDNSITVVPIARDIDDIINLKTNQEVPAPPSPESNKALQEAKITQKVADLTSVRQKKNAKKEKQKEENRNLVEKDKIRLMKTNQVVAMEAAIRKGVEDALAYLRHNEEQIVNAFVGLFRCNFLMGNMSLNLSKVNDLSYVVSKLNCTIVSAAIPHIGICGRYKLSDEDHAWFEQFIVRTTLLENHIRHSVLDLNNNLVQSATQGFTSSVLRFDIAEGANPASWYALFVKLRVAKGVQKFFEDRGFYTTTKFEKDVLLLVVQWTNIV